MSKKLILILTVAFFFYGFNLAQAGVVINEFVSDPDSGPEWVELLNTSSSEINLSDWKWTEFASPGTDTEHESSPKSLSGIISAGGFFVFEMSTALNNSGDSIGLYNGTNLEDRVTFGTVNGYSKDLDNPVKGKSGALISGTWETNQDPTKDAQNPSSPPPPVDNSSSSESSSSSSSSSSASSPSSNTPEPKPQVVENPTMKAKIIANTLAFTGQPLEMQTKILGYSNENVVLGRAYWNFGDGGSLEQINNFEKFYHIYYYPGEYVLFLEYYQNNFSKIPEATSKMIIKVLPTTVTISKVGDAKDFFIELSNNASSDIDVSNWVINAGVKSFILPKNSVIMSKKKTTISSKVTGFTYGDQYNLKLFSSTGELVFDYASPVEPIKILAKNSVPIKISTALQPLGEAIPPPAEQISAENLLATPAGAQVSVLPPLIIPLASLVFIGTSAGVVYFIRRKKIIPQTGSDFEILDE